VSNGAKSSPGSAICDLAVDGAHPDTDQAAGGGRYGLGVCPRMAEAVSEPVARGHPQVPRQYPGTRQSVLCGCMQKLLAASFCTYNDQTSQWPAMAGNNTTTHPNRPSRVLQAGAERPWHAGSGLLQAQAPEEQVQQPAGTAARATASTGARRASAGNATPAAAVFL
jgi:hypothetical protein